MSARVTEHIRRKAPGPPCRSCKQEIRPGELYRQLVAVNHEAFSAAFELWNAHTACVYGQSWWTVG